MKPIIIVLSQDTDDTFNFQSVGWYDIKSRSKNPKKCEALMKKARACISAGSDVTDVIKRLKKAGFSIKRLTPKEA